MGSPKGLRNGIISSASEKIHLCSIRGWTVGVTESLLKLETEQEYRRKVTRA